MKFLSFCAAVQLISQAQGTVNPAATQVQPDLMTVLSSDEGQGLAHLFYKGVNGSARVESLWQPDDIQVRDLMGELPRFLNMKFGSMPYKNWRFQLIGYTCEGRKYIFINALGWLWLQRIHKQYEWKTNRIILS
ncbi:MAG: hypothetical protein IPL96_17705, partial [Holophagaceae bacterium]|nr:hypothetical protein [Holophagaceae bacterium]